MNTLSWYLYLANVLPNIGTALGILAVPAFIAAASCIGCWLFATGTEVLGGYVGDSRCQREVLRTADQATKDLKRLFVWPARIFSTVFVVFTIGCILSPTRETMYAIAASEVGEDVLNSPTGSKAVRALDAWLDRQIAPTAAAAQ